MDEPGSVRPAREQDLDRLALLVLAMAEAHEALDPRYAVARHPDPLPELRGWLAARRRAEGTRLLVFERGPQLEGFVLAALAERPPPFRERHRGVIEQLYVRPEARRGGAGRALALAALAWLREARADRVALEVAGANPEARAFWASLGFAHSMDGLDRPL